MKKEVNNKIKSFEKISWKSEEELLFKEKISTGYSLCIKYEESI